MSEPRYVQRDEDGNVIGHFANEQPYAKECVPPDHPDILAWEAKRATAQAEYLRRKAELSPERLLARIAALEAKLNEGKS